MNSVTTGPRPSTVARWSIPGLSATFLLLVLIALAIVRPIIGYDSWWYHLPFSSFIWDIAGGQSNFRLDPMAKDRWLGFPKLYEWIQGLFWWATGSINSIVMPHILLSLMYFYGASRIFRIPAAYIILAFFACPMLLLHFEGTYLDLPVAIGIALGYLLLSDLLADARTVGSWSVWRRACAAIALFALAGNSKYQGLIACIGASAILVAESFVLRPLLPSRRVALIGVLAAANLAASASAIGNLIHFNQPFYPLEVRIAGTTLSDGPEDPELGAEHPEYLLRGSAPIALPEPINFILSATELDWTMRGVAPWYNYDSVTGDTPRRGPPSRTGGWGGLFVLVNVWLLCVQVFRLRRQADPRQRLMVINTVLIVVMVACLPRAHDLRYWLFLPLIVIPVNLRFLCEQDTNGRFVPHLLAVMLLYGLATVVLSPKSGLLEPRLETQQNRLLDVPPDVRRALAQTGRYCDPQDDQLFRYSTAATGLTGVLSRNSEDCR